MAKLISKRRYVTGETLYDLEVDGHHNFYANGVLVHNCHRFSKNVQDAFLPAVEDGTIIFLAGTTSNPYFSVIGPLLSRSQIFEFKSLGEKELYKVLLRGINYYKGEGIKIHIQEDAAKYLVAKANGDARKVLFALELSVESFNATDIDLDLIKKVMPTKFMLFDKKGSASYDLQSAIQNSIQFSDPDTAVYWLARAIESGEDPLYIARRLFVSAAEDVGVGDPIAVPLAHATFEACRVIGLPECALHLSTLVVYLASRPRNKSAAVAIWEALADVRDEVAREVPPPLRDMHYSGAEQLGHGACKDGMNPEHFVKIDKRYWRPEEWES